MIRLLFVLTMLGISVTSAILSHKYSVITQQYNEIMIKNNKRLHRGNNERN